MTPPLGSGTAADPYIITVTDQWFAALAIARTQAGMRYVIIDGVVDFSVPVERRRSDGGGYEFCWDDLVYIYVPAEYYTWRTDLRLGDNHLVPIVSGAGMLTVTGSGTLIFPYRKQGLYVRSMDHVMGQMAAIVIGNGGHLVWNGPNIERRRPPGFENAPLHGWHAQGTTAIAQTGSFRDDILIMPGGTFIMHSGTITGDASISGAGLGTPGNTGSNNITVAAPGFGTGAQPNAAVVEIHGGTIQNSYNDGIHFSFGDADNPSRLEMTGGTIRNNGRNAVRFTSTSLQQFEMSGGTLSDSGSHGIEFTAANNAFTMTGGTIERNNGHGVYAPVPAATITLDGGIIEHNALHGINVVTAPVAAIATSNVRLYSGNIRNNVQSGVNVAGNVVFNMADGSINNNTNGVVLAVAGAATPTFNMQGGTIRNHTGGNSGYGLNVQSGTAHITGGEIHNNRLGVNIANGTANIGGNAVVRNNADLGVYVADGTLNLGDNAEIHNNTLGGVHLDNANARLNMSGGAIRNNTAGNLNGGAIRITDGIANITNGRITDNTAKNGGGIGFDGSPAQQDTVRNTLQVHPNVVFSGNHATDGLRVNDGIHQRYLDNPVNTPHTSVTWWYNSAFRTHPWSNHDIQVNPPDPDDENDENNETFTPQLPPGYITITVPNPGADPEFIVTPHPQAPPGSPTPQPPSNETIHQPDDDTWVITIPGSEFDPAYPPTVGNLPNGYEYNITDTPGGDRIITITRQRFTVTFILQGGTYNGNPADIVQTTHHGGSVTGLTYDPTRQFYNFDGWLPTLHLSNVTADRYFRAQWRGIPPTVYFPNSNDRPSSSTNPENDQSGNGIGVVPNPNPSPGSNDNWLWEITFPADSIPQDGTPPAVGPLPDGYTYTYHLDGNGDLVVRIYPPVTVIFDLNGGTYQDDPTRIYRETERGGSVTPPTNPSRPGYIFGGWGVSPDGPTVSPDFGNITGDRTYYAQWLPLPPGSVEITVPSPGNRPESSTHPEDGTSGIVITENADGSYNVLVPGGTFDPSRPPYMTIPESDGYTWSYDMDSGGNMVVTIRPPVRVTFILDGGTYMGNPANVVRSTPVGGSVSGLSEFPQRVGYVFTGWAPLPVRLTNVRENRYFTAQWQPEGTNEVVVVLPEIGGTPNSPTHPEGENGGITVEKNDDGSYTVTIPNPDGEIDVNDIYVSLPYEDYEYEIIINDDGDIEIWFFPPGMSRFGWIVTFILNGGLYNGSEYDVLRMVGNGGDALPLSALPRRVGYYFFGWSPALNLTNVTENRTFTARWIPSSEVGQGGVVVVIPGPEKRPESETHPEDLPNGSTVVQNPDGSSTVTIPAGTFDPNRSPRVALPPGYTYEYEIDANGNMIIRIFPPGMGGGGGSNDDGSGNGGNNNNGNGNGGNDNDNNNDNNVGGGNTGNDSDSGINWVPNPNSPINFPPRQVVQVGDSAESLGSEAYHVPPVAPLTPEELETIGIVDIWSGFHDFYIRGYPDGTVQPNGFLTRAEMAQAFFNLSADSSRFGQSFAGFTDVLEEHWHFEPISFFANIGALAGFPNGQFMPNEFITNAEFATFATLAFNLDRLAIHNYIAGNEGHWAENYINIGFDMGWFAFFGTDYVFRPDAPITRAQAATLINHYTGRIPNPVYINQYLNGRQLFPDLDHSHWGFYQMMEAIIPHHFERNGNTEHWTN